MENKIDEYFKNKKILGMQESARLEFKEARAG